MPTIAELRAVTQPEGLLLRRDSEHWAGRLYMRRLSPHLTRLLVRTPLTANAVTALMIPTGLGAALALTFPGVWAALAALALGQLWLLLDCSDGEVARWRRVFSPAGPFLDGIAHYASQAAIVAALGVRADGGWDSLAGWTTLGVLAALLIVFVALESYLVSVARQRTGRPPLENGAGAPGLVGRARRAIDFVPFYRAFNVVEATLLAVVAAVVDAIADDLVATRVLVAALVAAAALTVVGHLLVILASDRLK